MTDNLPQANRSLEDQLNNLGQEIDDLRQSLRSTVVEQASKIGARLLQAKKLCRHGAWLPWLADRQISERSAQNYMKLANKMHELAMTNPKRRSDFINMTYQEALLATRLDDKPYSMTQHPPKSDEPELRQKTVETAAFDLDGVSEHFTSKWHIEAFKAFCTAPSVQPMLPVEQQAPLAEAIRMEGEERDVELTGSFIRHTAWMKVDPFLLEDRRAEKEEQERLEQQSPQAKLDRRVEQMCHYLEMMGKQGRLISLTRKEHPDIILHVSGEVRHAIDGALDGLNLLRGSLIAILGAALPITIIPPISICCLPPNRRGAPRRRSPSCANGPSRRISTG